jgi:hypothetical protein
MTVPERSVSLGFIHGGTVRVEFMISVMNVIGNPLIGNMRNCSAGPLIALARNKLVEQFLLDKYEWLWFVDTDIVFREDAINKLCEVADPDTAPIVSAFYYTIMDGKKVPAIYKDSPEGHGVFDAVRFYPEDKLFEVNGVGAGCLLIHRSVLEDIRMKGACQPCWFREMVIGDREIGEDLSFCIRARNCLAPIHVHTGVQVGHVKNIVLGELK